MMTTDNQQVRKCFQVLKTILLKLDTFFKIPRTYTLSHINDDTDTISRAESERRLCLLMGCLGLCLDFGLAILIVILISLEQNQLVPIRSEMEKLSSKKETVNKFLKILSILKLRLIRFVCFVQLSATNTLTIFKYPLINLSLA